MPYPGKSHDEIVAAIMHKNKAGKLKSGSGKAVTSRDQAIAIALSEARKYGPKK